MTTTYAELAEWIADMSEDQRQSSVTVFVEGTGEYYPLMTDYPLHTAQESDVLDKGHPYLKI